MNAPDRSLFLRFFLASAATMFVVWIGVLLWEVFVIQNRFEHVQVAETKGWTRQILASVGSGQRSADEIRDTIRRIETARDDMFAENGFRKPDWQLQVWRDCALVYASKESTLPTDCPSSETAPSLDSRWTMWTEADPASHITVRLAQEFVIAWTFALPGFARQFSPLLYCFPFLLVTAWLTIRYGLRPLNAVVSRIERRSASDLSPLPLPAHRELAPLIDSTNRLMDRLSERLNREQEFLVDAAHQLKTPLAVVRSNAELVTDANDAATAAAALAGLHDGVNDATHVVHQLLALARSGAHSANEPLEQVDLAELVRNHLALAAVVAMERDIDIEFDSPESCCALLRQNSAAALIDNLVGNAVKYSPDGGHVQVRLIQTTDIIELSVADEGPGIPEAMRKKVFERFFRMPDQDQPGSGLGLAIVERAATHNHARVSLRSGTEDRGLTVEVVFSKEQMKSTTDGVS